MDKNQGNDLPLRKIEPEDEEFQNDTKSDLDEKSENLQNHKVESEEKEGIGIEIRCKMCDKTFSKKYYFDSHTYEESSQQF